MPTRPRMFLVCYLVFGLAWVLGFDPLVMALFRQTAIAPAQLDLLKDVLFVASSAVFLAFLIARYGSVYRRKVRELAASEERYRLVVEGAPDAILIHDGVACVYANLAAARLFGAASPAMLLGRSLLDLVDASCRDAARARLRRNVEDAAPVTLREQRYLRLDGTPLAVESAGVPFPLGERRGALVFLRDIGERKAAAQSLRESEAKYRLLADNAHDLIFTLDPELHPTYISPSVRRLRGISVERAMGQSLREILTPASYAAVLDAVGKYSPAELSDAALVEHLELELVRGDGGTVWVETVVRPMFGDDERFLGYVGVCRDCTQRRRAEAERQRSEQFLARILTTIPDPVFVKNAEHRFVLVNEALCAMLGHPREELLGRLDEDFVSLEEAKVFLVGDDLVLSSGKEHLAEERLTDNQGRSRSILTKKGLLVDTRGGRFIVGVIRDVTAEREQEARLRDSLREKEVLLQEVHHRVKNNLQIISSLLSLQKEEIADPAVQGLFEESRNRLASMALVHEELYRSGNLGQVDLKEYLERLVPKVVASLRGEKTLRVSLALTSCRLPLDKVIPFGLVVNELLTNAVKHGFAQRSTGHIRVALDVENAVARLVVEDDGAGLPPGFHPESVTTLGLQLVVQLTRQLRGALTFGSGAGAVFRVSFPLG